MSNSVHDAAIDCPAGFEIDKKKLFADLNNGIAQERRGLFERNLAKNKSLIREFGGLRRIVTDFEGKNVVVAGAGPSLESNPRLLKRLSERDDIVIVATDMAVKTLTFYGIRPEFVISCETMPVNFFASVDTGRMHLIAFSCMSHSNLRKWNGDISFYNWMIHDRIYEPLWHKAGVGLGYLATGSIVTTQAVSLALGCGIKSLMMIGNDMGFADRFYARGTIRHDAFLYRAQRCAPVESYEMQLIRKNKKYELRRSENRYYTNNQFLAAKIWLEDLIPGQACSVYDCSVPGCSGDSVVRIDLKKYSKMFLRKRK